MLENHFKAGTGPIRTFIGARIFVTERDCAAWIRWLRRREDKPRKKIAARTKEAAATVTAA
jgi:hypothetical protein